MVIISTSAMEVSIQAVSPELGAHLAVTAFFGSGSLAQAAPASGPVRRRAAAGGRRGAAAPGAGAWA